VARGACKRRRSFISVCQCWAAVIKLELSDVVSSITVLSIATHAAQRCRWVREMYAFDVATALADVPLLLKLPVRAHPNTSICCRAWLACCSEQSVLLKHLMCRLATCLRWLLCTPGSSTSSVTCQAQSVWGKHAVARGRSVLQHMGCLELLHAARFD